MASLYKLLDTLSGKQLSRWRSRQGVLLMAQETGKAAVDGVQVGERLRVSFERTLRLPDDGHQYPLTPSLGSLPIYRIEAYGERVPPAWREQGGVFIPLHAREALFINFVGAGWKPNAVKVGVGGINAVSGEPWDVRLHGGEAGEQDYLVCPPQPWLDGINAGLGFIRQFVAMPLGQGYTVEGQLTGKESVGGIQILVYEPNPGRFPDEPPARERSGGVVVAGTEEVPLALECPIPEGVAGAVEAAMGLGAGGQMTQKIYPDPYGLKTWQELPAASLWVHLVSADAFRAMTGEEPPPTPISAELYTAYGLPWFALADQGQGDVAASPPLSGVKTVQQLQRECQAMSGAERREGAPDAVDPSVTVPDRQIVRLGGAAPDEAPGHDAERPPRRTE